MGQPAQIVIPTGPEAAGQARTYVREVLANGDFPVGAACLDDVLLILSELVTNSYRYGTEPGDSMRVVVLTTPVHVRIEVHDPVRRHPEFRETTEERVRGRGLHIVDALAARWDVDDRPFGKAVWAEVPRYPTAN
ncbi:ATP-binding protein [Streptomyces sp. NPDC007084]|uniref:ATP-binding protein n=1 Tax=Streptomyces sp. NPDC007084 TaxID=3154313 RepID=UPI00345444D0